MHFFTLKGLTPGDIHAELVSVYGVDVLVLHTFYKWHKRFAQGKTDFSMIRDLGDSCRMISPKPFVLCFRNAILLHAKGLVPASGLRRLCT
jgi:hypothetical protein